jgi:hypothetical protein
MNIFEEATRLKLRFQTVKGNLTVEQLWDLSLDNGESNLYKLASELVTDIQNKPEEALSFFKKANNKKNELAELKFDIVKYIVTSRVAEIEEKTNEAVKKSEIEELNKLIAAKEFESKANLSLEELKALKEQLTK